MNTEFPYVGIYRDRATSFFPIFYMRPSTCPY